MKYVHGKDQHARALALLTLTATALACGGTNASAPRDPVEPAPSASALPPPPSTQTAAAALLPPDAGAPVRSSIDDELPIPTGLKPSPLGAAGRTFAIYLVGMHDRIHPIFVDDFLSSLDKLPPSHQLNDRHLRTALEIVLAPDGTIERMGITRSSGVTTFDIATLNAVMRAAPYGPLPPEMLSADGKMYVGWTFTRDESLACSTTLAHPYLFIR